MYTNPYQTVSNEFQFSSGYAFYFAIIHGIYPCIRATNKFILLTKHKELAGRIWARGLDSTDQAQQHMYKIC